MAWFISPPTSQQNSGATDFYLGRRTVTVQTTENTTGYAFVQQLTSDFAYQSSVPGSIVPIPRNGTVEINLSNYPAGYYRVVAGTSFTPDNYLSQSGLGNIHTPPLPVIYRTFTTDAYTLPTPPQLTISFPSFPYLQFNWNQQAPSDTIKAEWRAADDPTFTTVEQLTETSYLAESFEYGGQYEVRISVKSAFSGEYSLPTTLSITYPADTLATPTALVTPLPSAVKVEWSTVPNAARYLVRYKLHITSDAWVIRTITDTQITIDNIAECVSVMPKILIEFKAEFVFEYKFDDIKSHIFYNAQLYYPRVISHTSIIKHLVCFQTQSDFQIRAVLRRFAGVGQRIKVNPRHSV